MSASEGYHLPPEQVEWNGVRFVPMVIILKRLQICFVAAGLALFTLAGHGNAATIGYNVVGGLDLDCTHNGGAVVGGCGFRAMFELTDPVMDGATGNVPANIMFELVDSSDTVLSSYNGPFTAATVVVLPNGDVTESDITDSPGNMTGYSLSAGFWSWALDGFSVPIDFVDLNGVSVTPKPIPLPAAAWLLLSALAGMGIMSWRRKSTESP